MTPGVGMPALLYLNEFGRMLRTVFGWDAYLVGSALAGKGWRDVDVRVILPDAEFDARYGGIDPAAMTGSAWSVTCMAYAALGARLTGLPIDFQVYPESKADTFDTPLLLLGEVTA